MKLYRIQNLFVGTGADAKAAAAAAGLYTKGQGFDAEQFIVEVPVSKAELIAYLNELVGDSQASDQCGEIKFNTAGQVDQPVASTAGGILDKMDRQLLKTAVEIAVEQLKAALKGIERKHSGEPGDVVILGNIITDINERGISLGDLMADDDTRSEDMALIGDLMEEEPATDDLMS